MKQKKIDTKALDIILEKMISTVDNSKDEIFSIGEQSRVEMQRLLDELQVTRRDVDEVIQQHDRMETQSRLARQRLSDVSRNFNVYSEAQIREAYEVAHKLQSELAVLQVREQQLRERRDDLERRLISVKETVERSEMLVSQVSIVLNFLQSDIRQVGDMLKDASEKQEFGFRIIEAQEEERKRLSREIHDGPAQMMANVMMRSELIERIHRERSPEEAMQEIRDLRKMVRSALYEVRRIIYDLRPMALDDLGLVPTLRKYLKTIEEYNKTTAISFANFGLEERLPPKFEVALFRLSQEAVQNAIKHAEAHEIQVKLEVRSDAVTLVVKDDGKGFDLDTKKESSFGLLSMKERVELLDGSITVHSKDGLGTLIQIRIPIQEVSKVVT